MPVGLDHAKRIADLRETLTALRDAATDDFAVFFGDQLAQLDGWAARIAAIGQVKAGKSSTLNALIEQSDFLPSDVNPWTTVVTDLRVNVPGDPRMGARFDFFDETSWDRIINGDRRVRKAAKAHLPGFDPEILRSQTEEMRAYAEKRLGPSYTKLLGKNHSYDILSDGLLESYVCAGAGTDPRAQKGELGRYSSITKAANIYLEIPEFRVPTIITDTPGVNDPFLVRDEFTCQALDRSDIFLVMLSAHQPLTEVDVALIRMLSMQGGKDVVIFINRVDELENRAACIARLIADVEERLNEAVPNGSFTLLYGSAHWAKAAMNEGISDDDLRAFIDGERLDDLDEGHGAHWVECPRAKLYEASGLPAIKRALSKAIEQGSGARFLDRLVHESAMQIAAMKTLSQRRRNDLQDRIDMYATGRLAECREEIEDEMARLADIHARINDIDDALNTDLDRTMNDYWVALQCAMDQQIANFIQRQKKTVQKLWSGETKADGAAEIDLLPLRVALESTFHHQYEKARQVLDRSLSKSLAEAMTVARSCTGPMDAHADLDTLPGKSVAVTFAASAKSLRIDLIAKRSWAFWREKQVDLDKTMDGLRKVTAAEVFPATSKMVEAFMATTTERVTAGKGRLETVGRIVEQSLNDRIKRLRQDRKLLAKEDTPAMREKMLNRLRSDIEVIDDRLRVIATHESALTGPGAHRSDTPADGTEAA